MPRRIYVHDVDESRRWRARRAVGRALLLPVLGWNLAASAQVERFDLLVPRDGLILHEVSSGSYWVGPSVSTGLAALDFCGFDGGGESCGLPTIGDGWRRATTAEACRLLRQLGVSPDPCPGMRDFGPGELEEPEDLLLDAIQGLGFTHLFVRDGNLWVQSNALVGMDLDSLGLLSAGRVWWPFSLLPDELLRGHVSVTEDVADGGYADPEVGHLLVRPSLPGRGWPELPGADESGTPVLPSDREPCVLGAIPFPGGTTFRIWAPASERVAVLDMDALRSASAVYEPDADKGFSAYLAVETEQHPECWADPAEPEPREGIWSADIEGAAVGDAYRFMTDVIRVENAWTRRDPRGRLVDSSRSDGSSVVYDRSAFHWQGEPEPQPDSEVAIGVSCPRDEIASWVLYHLGTREFAPPAAAKPHGDFDGVLSHLRHLEALGVNAVLVEPVSEYPDAGDPEVLSGHQENPYAVLDPFAIERDLGGPDELKELVREFHRRGIALLADMELALMLGRDSTFFIDGWYSGVFQQGRYFHSIEFPGKAGLHKLNFSEPEVMDFGLDRVETFLREFHIDGFRFDSAEHYRVNGFPTRGAEFQRRANELACAYHAYSFAEDWGASCSRHSHPLCGTDEYLYDVIGFAGREGATGLYSWQTRELGAAGAARAVRAMRRADPDDDPRPLVREAVRSPADPDRAFRRYKGASHAFGGSYVSMMIECADVEEPHELWRCAATPDPDSVPSPFSEEVRRLAAAAAVIAFTGTFLPRIKQGEEFLRATDMDWGLAKRYPGHLRLYSDLIRLRTGGNGATTGLTLPVTDVFHPDFAVLPNEERIVAWRRGGPEVGAGGEDVLVLLNTTREKRSERIGLPRPGLWKVRLDSDSKRYGTVCQPGDRRPRSCSTAGFGRAGTPRTIRSEAAAADGFAQSAVIPVGPFSAVILSCDRVDRRGICHGAHGRKRRSSKP